MSWPHACVKEAGLKVAEAFARIKPEKTGAWDYYSAARPGRVPDLRDLAQIQAEICSQPLRFRDCAASMREARMDTVVEIGPGHALGAFVRKLDSGVRALATEDAKSLSSALKLAI